MDIVNLAYLLGAFVVGLFALGYFFTTMFALINPNVRLGAGWFVFRLAVVGVLIILSAWLVTLAFDSLPDLIQTGS